MWWFLGMLSLPIGFCLAYLIHSIRMYRYVQSAVIGLLTALNLASVAMLLYEFYALP